MRAKSLILLVVALGCGMVAAVAVSKAVMDNGSTDKVEAMVEIFVAVKDLPHAEKISAENVKLEKWPKTRVPEGALFALDQVEDKFTNQTIFAGEPILERKIRDTRESFSTGVPQGYRIFDIVGSAGYIKPGDHVDILGTFPTGGRNSPPESVTVMRNVKVHGINGITIRESENDQAPARGKGTVFQLLVKESQLEALTLANSMGTLQLNLRPFGEDEDDDTDNGETFLSWIDSQNEEPPETKAEPAKSNFLTRSLEMAAAAAPPAEEPKHQMLIITPNGVKKYEWSDKQQLPREVVEEPEQSENRQLSNMPANGYAGASGNVYSGYGNYSPTYPTSVSPSDPATAEDAQNPTVQTKSSVN